MGKGSHTPVAMSKATQKMNAYENLPAPPPQKCGKHRKTLTKVRPAYFTLPSLFANLIQLQYDHRKNESLNEHIISLKRKLPR